MKKYYIWLLQVFGYANPLLTELLERFETPDKIYGAFCSNTAAAGAEYAERAEKIALESAESLVQELESKNIKIITIESELYPEALRNIEVPPCVLFAKGNISLLEGKLVTIAGSRKISDYTIAAQTKVCEKLCQKYTLVASLVTGCEQLACLTAIKQGKGCIEILPCGFEQDYPKGTHVLREQILMNGGCILTEFLPDVKASNINFIRRARITGSISKAMIIFQAKIGSGSLNAAKYSQALFFLPPNNVFSAEYAGAVHYLRNGASLYLSEEDIDRAFEESFTQTPIDIKPQKKQNKKAPAESKELSKEHFATPVHFLVCKIIYEAQSPITFDEIYRNVDMDITELNEIIVDLQIADMVKPMPGNRYMPF